LLAHSIREDGNLSILMPRFKNRISARIFQPGRKKPEIPIKLDRFGSATWLLIDSVTNVEIICRKLEEMYPESLLSREETEERVTRFLSMLYQQRYITFTEISD
jgi:hypothetical protein